MNLWSPSDQTRFDNVSVVSRMSLLLIILAVAPIAFGQQPTASPDEVTETIKQLRKQVADLEARTKYLEARLSKSAPLPTPQITPIGSATELTPVERESDQATREANASLNQTEPNGGILKTPLMQIRGFSDLSYRVSNVKGETNSFALGQFDLFINSRLSDKINVLAEMVFEGNEKNSVEFDLERMLLQYAVSDHFNLNIGRYHTAIGFYNTAYHHGSWFETAIGRPFLFAFEDEGGILPIHNVGVSINGRIPSGKLGLSYIAEMGNGRASRSRLDEPVQNEVDENNRKAFNLGIQARPQWAPGLQVGFNVYRDRLTPEGLNKIGQTIWAAHAIYQTPTFEFLNEGLIIRHAISNTNRTINTPAFYTQVSRRLYNRLRPYFRYEYLNVPDSDPIYNDVGRQNGPAFGMRYDLAEFAALKMQYNRTASRAKSTNDAVQVQFAFTF